MAELKGHWTNRDADDFLYRIAFDFVNQLEKALETEQVSQARLAKRLGVTEGRVSQVLNNPGNLTLKKVVQYARAIGRKVSIVAYDDRDGGNKMGPINSEIFAACWDRVGRPRDFFDLHASNATAPNFGIAFGSGRSLRIHTYPDQAATVADARERRDVGPGAVEHEAASGRNPERLLETSWESTVNG
ncbi:MAG: XRE family transcriptional regulator [Acidobacteria bacterium]|nr:XRE family transcriptional regulator [Acidobacteriota bacterium]